MYVKVEDGLSCSRPNVQHCSISLFDVALASDLGGGQVALSDNLGIFLLRFLEAREMLLGNDQDVGRSLRMNVFKSENVLVFVNLFRGNFSANDSAEEAIRVHHNLDSQCIKRYHWRSAGANPSGR